MQIVDKCIWCDVDLYYDPENDRYQWENDGGLDCEHEGENHGHDPRTCPMCQGNGGEVIVHSGKITVARCDKCHGTGTNDINDAPAMAGMEDYYGNR